MKTIMLADKETTTNQERMSSLLFVNSTDELLDIFNKQEDIDCILMIDDGSYDIIGFLEEHQNDQWVLNSLITVLSDDQKRKDKAISLGIVDYLPKGFLETPSAISGYLSHLERLVSKKRQWIRGFNCDGLTGLCNQANAMVAVNGILKRHQDEKLLFGMIDIDYFKHVNDLMGHEFGNKVLKEVAKRLKENAGESGVAIRYGGDEFAILASNKEANDLFASACFTLDGYHITCSMGFAKADGNKDYDTLFRQADQALYLAKANGKNQYKIYEAKMEHDLTGTDKDARNEKLNISPNSLIHALANGYCLAYGIDLHKVAASRLTRLASGEYGFSDPLGLLSFNNQLLQLAIEKEKLRFSEFINPVTLAARLKERDELSYHLAGVDGNYQIQIFAGDRNEKGTPINALLLVKMIEEPIANDNRHDEITAIEKCLASSLTTSYNALWLISPKTFARELISIQTDISRHRRINRLFEKGNYWDDTKGYVNLFVEESERDKLLKAINPTILLSELANKDIYIVDFHRTIDGNKCHCEYRFLNAIYNDEKVIIQLYRRLNN